jgi:integron integrase
MMPLVGSLSTPGFTRRAEQRPLCAAPDLPALTAPRLMDRVRERIRGLHYSLRTEEVYTSWCRAFIRFHGLRHPADMGAPEVEAFLTHLAVERSVSSSTHNQALSALLFLYGKVLGVNLPWLTEIGRPAVRRRLPVVLTREEVAALLARLSGEQALLARLLYGTGLRISEALQLRVKDIDFRMRAVIVREGKGGKDRVVMLPASLEGALRDQLRSARRCWEQDVTEQRAGVEMPHALERKFPRAGQSWSWFWVFPQDQAFDRSAQRRGAAGTTSTTRPSSAPSSARCRRPASPSPLHRTPCGIRLPPICCSRGRIFEPCRSCSATPMWPPP